MLHFRSCSIFCCLKMSFSIFCWLSMVKNSSFSTSPDGNSPDVPVSARLRTIPGTLKTLRKIGSSSTVATPDTPRNVMVARILDGVFLVENPTKMDDLGVPPFQETTILKEDIWWKKKSASWENVLGIWLEGEFFLGPIRILRVYGRKKSRKYGASLGEASRTKNGFPTTQILLGIGTKYAGTKNMYWFQGLRI